MKEKIEYLIEYKLAGSSRYHGRTMRFKSRKVALDLAAGKNPTGKEKVFFLYSEKIVSYRVIEQRRKVLKVFPNPVP
ncbi:hypothetical protein LCGC14_2357930 [marine sediment metagenome]|uniref:Uncharacterized protein n=1 Tax=marine sediment metagenome TaxID=412755 RepID=A0A0F9EJX7_9ZZZZ|nr:hypothetical protein [Desulfobacterales bacterium]